MLNATDVIATYDLDGKFTFVSPAIFPLTGQRPEELIGRSALDVVDPDDRARVMSEFVTLLRSGSASARIEYRALRRDGSTVWVEAHPAPVKTPDGTIIGFQDVARDISARRQAQEAQEAATLRAEAALAAARASEARFRLLAENANDMMATMSPDSTVLFVTAAVFRLLGYTPEEVVGRKTLELTHPTDVAGVVAMFAGLIKAGPDGPARPYRFRGRHKSGAWVWLEGQPRVEFDASGAPVRFQDVVRDVTERVKATQAAVDSERRYRVMADNTTDVICRSGIDGRIKYVSPSSEQMVGYAPDDLVGKSTLTFIDPQDAARVTETYRIHVAGGPAAPPIEMEFRVRRRDGRMIWVEGRPRIAWSQSGVALEVFDVLRDITARKHMEEQLAHARACAAAAAQAKADFLANMSHELRTPLTGILGYAGVLARTPTLDALSRRRAEMIGDAGELLLTLVNDVLDMSKIEAGGVALDPRPTEIGRLVRDTASFLREQASAKGLDLRAEVPERAWPVLVDPERLRQVLLNLLMNAVKFTAAGHVQMSLHGATTLAGTVDITIEVRDTGIGIAAERLGHVFKRFEQADGSITRRFGGTGLGLAISHAIVQALGGTLTVESRLGEGSAFTVRLRLPEAECVQARPAALPAALTRMVPRHVLVADDVEMNRDVIRLVLEARGIQVTCVADGAAATRAVPRFDLVLMDVHMPVMNGLDATRLIRAGMGPNARTPILALTASVLPDEVARCRDAGMDGHIGKPFTPDGLVAAVMAALAPGDACAERVAEEMSACV